ncbi:uncharacterized protein FIESC28_04838 [Fusarium coffeatum]|uniref:Extracellular mutant protein 11 C-terminal domain-containing protein n=1 Tax=Fusarium coffeatum TaxID=231269 RepID=A0A366RYR6_9HYPO|nr:uncharacterized protein FIESC28_04838 [Fusarium coffeatum]RBR21570.1 hypothetical protein FIESC28_04838 [Fusarium coffeatum]
MRHHEPTKHPIAARVKGHRVTGSAPLSLQSFHGKAGRDQANHTMPPSLKDKGGRLLAFANAGTKNELQSQVDIKSSSVEPPRNAAPPPAPTPRPSSFPREIAVLGGRNTAPPRQNHPFSQPPPPHSPRSQQLSVVSSPNGHARPNSNGRPDLFSGSQLDDNFLESGLTTPYNEPSEPVRLGPELTRDLKKNIPSRNPDRNRFQRPAAAPLSDLFAIGDDLRMNVISRPQRHNIDHMGDGFQDNVNVRHGKANGHYNHGRARPESPARPDSRIPMREVKIRKSHTGRSEAYDLNRVPSPSPKRRETHRPSNHRIEMPREPTVHHIDDEDLESSSRGGEEEEEEEEEHATPRPKAAEPVIQRTQLRSIPPVTDPVPRMTRTDKKRRRPNPEYDDVALRSMSFTTLQQQPFDFDPSKDEQKGTGVDPGNIEAKLDQFRHLGEQEQHDLFSHMSIENWETSGNWFVNEFSGLMQRLMESRRNKRMIIQEFEQEAADREEAVRLRTEAVDRKLSKMKQDGQRVVDDKTG